MSLPGKIFSSASHIGINITVNSVGVVALDKSKKVSYQELITHPTPFFQGDTVDTKAVSDVLKGMLPKLGATSVKASVCFPERVAYSREYVLPKIDVKEVDEAVSWQLSSIFPLEPNDIYTDWKLLKQTDTNLKIAVVAVNRNFLDGLQQACEQAGIHPISFEPSASALSRCNQESTTAHVLLEVDNFGTSATLVEEGVSLLTTTTVFTKQDTLETVIENINHSLKHLVSYYSNKENESTEKQPLSVFLTGEKATSKLVELLKAATQLGVELLPSPIENPGLHVPYLAALSTILPPESEKSVNLLPTTLQHKYQLETDLGYAQSVATWGSVIAAVGLLMSAGFLGTALVINNQLTQKITAMNPQTPPQTTINIPLTLKKAQIISQLSSQKYVPTEALAALKEAGVFGSVLKKLNYDASKKKIQVAINNADREMLYEVKAGLEKTGKFSTISVPLSAFSSETGSEAIITLQIK